MRKNDQNVIENHAGVTENNFRGCCVLCGDGNGDIIYCSNCEEGSKSGGYHLACLNKYDHQPVLFAIPQGNWYCQDCNGSKLKDQTNPQVIAAMRKCIEYVESHPEYYGGINNDNNI